MLPRPTTRGNRCVPPSANDSPQRLFNNPSRAVSATMRKSHQHAGSIPRARHQPLTAAIVGLPGSKPADPIGPAESVYGCSHNSARSMAAAPERAVPWDK
jgi:hypothetical protein